ncbi:hypothetical protein IJ135_00675 [Candidatus Saccharibacteria bacterium]|nr:hypothetical protein [Candidatus Saccharibacteria bacterium]
MESKSENGVCAIDSCIILRFILRDVPEQVANVRSLLLDGHDYYVDDAVISECIHVMTREHRKRDYIVDDMLSLLRNSLFIWNRDFFEPVFKEYLEHPSLSFDDIVIAHRVESLGYAPLWTFDRKLAAQSPVARLLD